MTQAKLAGSFTFPNSSMTVNRMGYGAMQLAGPGVFGPPKDRAAAIAVLREAVASGRQPHRHQRFLRPARHQPDHPRGAASVPDGPRHRHQGRRAARRRQGRWNPAFSPRRADARPCTTTCATSASTRSTSSTCAACSDMHGPAEGSHRGAADGAGRAAATGPDPPHRPEQRHRGADRRGAGICRDRLRAEPLQPRAPRRRRADRRRWPRQGIAYVPFFPLGGFTPLQSSTLSDVAARLGATPMQVALAWLLQRAPTSC